MFLFRFYSKFERNCKLHPKGPRVETLSKGRRSAISMRHRRASV